MSSLEELSNDIQVSSIRVSGPLTAWQALAMEESRYTNLIVITPDIDVAVKMINQHLRLVIIVCSMTLTVKDESTIWDQNRTRQKKYNFCHIGHSLSITVAEMEVLLKDLHDNHTIDKEIVSRIQL